MVDDNWSRWKFLLEVVILAQILFLLFPKLDLHISVSVIFLVIPRVHLSLWENLSTLPYSYALHSRQPGECAQMSLVLFTNSIFLAASWLFTVLMLYTIYLAARKSLMYVWSLWFLMYFSLAIESQFRRRKLYIPYFWIACDLFKLLLMKLLSTFYVLYVMCAYRLYTT